MLQKSRCLRNLIPASSFCSLPKIAAFYASRAASSVQEAFEPSTYSGSDDENGDIDWDNLGFGIKQTDYMYITKSSNDGIFEQGQINRFGNIELNPSAGVLNYGQGLFEGTKAFRREDGRLFLFRPDQNAIRMQFGADRMCMPSPSIDQFVDAVKQTALANRRWEKGRFILDLCSLEVGLYWVWRQHLSTHSLCLLPLLATISRKACHP